MSEARKSSIFEIQTLTTKSNKMKTQITHGIKKVNGAILFFVKAKNEKTSNEWYFLKFNDQQNTYFELLNQPNNY